MTDDENTPENASGGGASLDGYLYQVDVSIWAALDLLLAKKLAHQLVLEPAGKDDLEATLSEDAPGRLVAKVDVGSSTLLVVQAKLRNTGPWKVGELASLLLHGTDRPSAAKRLEDTNVKYLLVTSAEVDGVARVLRLSGFGERPKTNELPATIAGVVPKNAGGRIGILANADSERLQWKLRELLEEAFRVPHSRLEACKSALREAALERMRGVGGGIWTREEVERIIKDHDGYLAASLEAETFVKPTNWNELKQALSENNAVIITGASGTGKTTAATVLLGELRAEVPGITPIHILHGPEEVRANSHAEPVVFVVEDPWGKYRLEPQSAPWNDEIDKLLATANGNRRFIITSRSDVLADSHTKKLSKKWNVTLEVENYGPAERRSLFENRLPMLPHPFQAAAAKYRAEALNRLRSPLEMQKYFDNLAEGVAKGEHEHQYIERCISTAHRDAIEQTIVLQVDSKQVWPWAAVIWGLLKARPKQSRAILPNIQAAIGERDRELEDGLDPFVNFMVNGRNLRQIESAISYYHPRVEAGLETAMGKRPGLSSRVFGYLLDVLIEINANDDDWGLESAAHLLRALRSQDAVPIRASLKTQANLDAWINKRLSNPGAEFRNDISLAADVGSPSIPATQLAKWLLTRKREAYSFGDSWSPDPDSDIWYERVATDPLTSVICDGFVRYVLPFQNESYPEDFSDHIGRLAPDLAPTFLEVAESTLSRGYDPNAEAIAHGAVKNLAGFEAVLAEAIAFNEKLRAEIDPSKLLALRNGEYDQSYAEHLSDAAGDDGYTADVFIKTYVHQLREKKGWTALRDHPRLDGILYAWVDWLRRAKGTWKDEEILCIAEKSFGHRNEDRFWSAATDNWRDSLTPKLLERIIAGHENHDVRSIAAYCFAQFATASSINQLLQKLIPTDTRRLVEIFLDLRGAWHSDDDRAPIEAFIETILQAIAEDTAEVAFFLLADVKPTPSLKGSALDFVRKLDPLDNRGLALEKAKLLAAAGDDASELINILVAFPRSDNDDDIGFAASALELAAAQANWPLVEGALAHRFADVREVALEALAPRTTGALPANLLVLARDKGSGVRRALAKILKDRPAPEHLDALVILAADDWSNRGGYYGEEENYPIAQEAAKILAEPPPLPESVLEPLIAISAKTQDPDVRWGLISAVAMNGGTKGIERICELAVSRESIKMSADAARALWLASDKVDEGLAAHLTTDHVTTRNECVSVFMAMAIGACAAAEQVMETATTLSALSKRRALILPLMVGASQRSETLAAIAKLLPPDQENAIMDAFANDTKLARDVLDNLADVRIVEEIRRRLSALFMPKST